MRSRRRGCGSATRARRGPSSNEPKRSATSDSATRSKPVGGDRRHRRVDAPDEVRSSGGRVVVGRREQRTDGEVERLLPTEGVPEAELDHRAGVQAAGARGGEVALLVASAGHVVLEQASRPAGQVEPGEQRHHGQPLHGGRQMVAHHRRELVGLAVEAQRRRLDLLVVLELELEQLDHVHGRPGRARDGDPGVAVGREHLLDGAVRDQVAAGRPAVAGHHDAVGVADGHDRRGVGDGHHAVERRGRCLRFEADAAQQLGEAGPRIVVGREHGQAHGPQATGSPRGAATRSPAPPPPAFVEDPPRSGSWILRRTGGDVRYSPPFCT